MLETETILSVVQSNKNNDPDIQLVGLIAIDEMRQTDYSLFVS